LTARCLVSRPPIFSPSFLWRSYHYKKGLHCQLAFSDTTDLDQASESCFKQNKMFSSKFVPILPTESECRRLAARPKALIKQQQEDILVEEEEGPEYVEYTDSEEETGPRLKPVFISKQDRNTKAQKRKKQLELEAKKLAEEKRFQTLKMVEDQVRKEMRTEDAKYMESGIFPVRIDIERVEAEYEKWKLREFRRIKRDREEREAGARERQEIERIGNMTEEERRAEFQNVPKQVTNKAPKGKYKFLQKYYHRGAFYLDGENEVLKRDFAGPTLADHFDKTVLPRVLQVKNFGRRGRTKYTHLIDQDPSQPDTPWASQTSPNLKFHTRHAGGVQQVFERPALRKKKIS
jgi:microfibrillar-associated protein 1